MEQDGLENSAVTRGQNIVYVMVHDWAASAQFLAPLLDKLDPDSREVQLLVLTSDAEAVAAIAAEAAKLGHDRGVNVVAATSPARAARLIRGRATHALVGTPSVIAELLRTATIKLETIRQVCVAWADELIANDQTTALESVMTEAPKDSARVIVTSDLTPAVTELIERYARRARRVAPASVELELPTTMEFVTSAAAGRSSALRRLLDDVDPQTALVFVRQPDHEPQLRDLLRALGYDGDDAPVRTGLVAAPNTDVAILYDLPASRQELREAVSGARRVIALVQPRQLSSLRALAAGGNVAPLTLSESGLRARNQETRMRQAVRDALLEGQFGRELLALEPLLEEFDGIEIAAATLRLLERERSATAAAAQTATSAHAAASASGSPRNAPRRDAGSGAMVRLFVNVGSRDGARAGDFVGALANQGGMAATDVGRVDVRESHTIVEVASGAADSVIERVTGSTIKGRRAVLRRDEERPRRSDRPASDRPARDFSRAAGGGRPPRPRGPRHEGRE